MDVDGDKSTQHSDRLTAHQYVLMGEIVVAAFWSAALAHMIFFWIVVAIVGVFQSDYLSAPLHEMISSFVAPFGGVFAIGYAFRSLMNAFQNKYPKPHWSQLIALLSAVLATFEFSKSANMETAILISSPMWVIAIHLVYLVLSRDRGAGTDTT